MQVPLPASISAARDSCEASGVGRAALAFRTPIVFTTDVVTIAGCVLVLLVVVGAAVMHLRSFVASEIGQAATETNARLEAAVADIRQEIRIGRELQGCIRASVSRLGLRAASRVSRASRQPGSCSRALRRVRRGFR